MTKKIGTFSKSLKAHTQERKSCIQSQRGFTLVDVAIALLVIGLLVAPLAQTYNNWEKETRRSNTSGNFRSASEAIDNFYFEFERYPCPADPTLGPNDANFGEEDCTGTNPNIAVAPVIDIDGDLAIDNVMIGALPFKELKLTPQDALDGWNSKITYAVTDLLTDQTTYNPGYGLITINRAVTLTRPAPGADLTCTGPADTTTSVHFAILSHGESGNGAFTHEGTPVQACPAAGATTDEENCNNDAVFTFPTCLENRNAGANFYDDMFLSDNLQETIAPTKIWDTGTNPQDIGSVVGYIGIGNDNPQFPVDVVGNIRATTDPSDPINKSGVTHATDYCDSAGSNCFRAESIAGNDPNMRCYGIRGMSGIGSNAAKCLNVVLPSASATSCPAGQYIVSITSAGVITCAAP